MKWENYEGGGYYEISGRLIGIGKYKDRIKIKRILKIKFLYFEILFRIWGRGFFFCYGVVGV